MGFLVIWHLSYPSGPVSDLLIRQSYVASYNRALRTPHWVAEHLNKDSLKSHLEDGDRRHAAFHEDQAIPVDFRSRLVDYAGSGYDRGHLVPAADVHGPQKELNETFLCIFTRKISPRQ